MQGSIMNNHLYNKGYKKLKGITDNYNMRWFHHYQMYLMELTYQLFEWKGLPDTIDPRFIEMQLHNQGYICFYRDKLIGDIVLQGATSGQINHYNLPLEFNPASVNYIRSKPIKLQAYNDVVTPGEDKGVLIMNNDLMRPSIEDINLFAIDLAEIKAIIRVNMNAQKTPVMIKTSETNQLSIKNAYNQYEGNAPVIIVDEAFGESESPIQVMRTDAPYVVDKLVVHKNTVWNEFMTFMGIDNANIEKRERLITSEAESNNEQIDSSGNRMLKTRQDACRVINKLYPDLNVSVDFRHAVIEQIRGELDGSVYNAAEGDY